jgi:cytidylate kinase
MQQTLKISIDGPTASGKTCLGTALTERCSGAFLDTGLTYRALAYAFARDELPRNVPWRSRVEHVPLRSDVAGSAIKQTAEAVFYCGRDITEDLWSFQVEQVLQDVARNSEWRDQVTEYHREILSQWPVIVAAGRDVATTLMGDADLQLFLYADEAVRRERRRAQYSDKPERAVAVGPMTDRDIQTREYVAGQAASLVIDTSALSAAAVFQMVLDCLERSVTASSG